MEALQTSELSSVVDFLRSEGKLKVAELDKLRAENERLKTKCERTQELLRKAEADRASQETDTRVFLTAEKHAELVKKVELSQVRNSLSLSTRTMFCTGWHLFMPIFLW